MAEGKQSEERATARIIRDPRLLPFFLKPAAAAVLCECAPRTLAEWRRVGRLVRGVHYTRRGRGDRAPVFYLRDALLTLMLEREQAAAPPLPPISSTLNPSLSGALAAALHREQHGL